MQSHAKSFSTSNVLRMMKSFNNAATDLRGGWQPSLSLELALAEVLDAPHEATSQPPALSSSGGTPVRTKPQPAPVSQTESNSFALSGASATREDEAQAPHQAEKSSLTSGAVIKVWKQLSASLPKTQANLSALLNSVRMIDVQGKTLILGLASDVLVSKIDKPEQIEAIQKLIKDEFGVDVNVRCTVTNAKGKIPPNVQQDGMVAAAIQHGGEIVDMQD
jgi:DNA polymerase III gamma/tau subunit